MQLPFTGRKKESFALNRIIKKAFAERTQTTVYLDGEAGIGKSRFIEEFIKSNNYKAHYIYCDEKKSSWQPLINFLKSYFQASSKLRNTKATFQAVFNDLYTNLTDTVLKKELNLYKSVLSGFIGIKSANSFFAKLEPRAQYENLQRALNVLLSAEFVKQPFVLIVEDAHWMDLDSIKFLAELQSCFIPILISSRYLNDDKEFCLDNQQRKRIKLLPLSENSCKKLFDFALKKNNCKHLKEKYILNSKGNPFVLKSLVESRLDLHEQINLSSAITKKLQSLSEEKQTILVSAAAMGQNPDKRILQAMYPGKNIELESFLTKNKDNLQFEHDLIRENVYQQQNKKNLSAVHLQIAGTIEKRYNTTLHKYCYELAEHYEKAYLYDSKEKESVKDLLLKSLTQCLVSSNNRFDNRGVIFYSDKIVKYFALKGDMEPVFNALDMKAMSYKYIGRWKDSKEIYETMLDFAYQIDSKDYILKAQKYLAGMVKLTSSPDEAILSAKKVLDFAQENNNLAYIADMQQSLGDLYYQIGELEKALDFLNQSLSLAKSTNYEIAEYRAKGTIANILIDKGEYDQAIKMHEESLLYAKKHNILQMVCTSLGDLGIAYQMKKDFDKAIYYYKSALEMAISISNKQMISHVSTNLGVLYMAQFKYRKAMESYSKSLNITESVGDKYTSSIIYSNIAAILLNSNKTKDAKKYLDKAISIFEANSMSYYLCNAYLNKAGMILDNKNYTNALYLLNKATVLAEKASCSDTALACNILKTYILAETAKSIKTSKKYFLELEKLYNAETDLDRKTFLYYKLVKLNDKFNLSPDVSREIALTKFRELYKIAPTKLVKSHIDKLAKLQNA